MPLFALSFVIQVALVLHIIKTGRNTTWIWIVVMLPGAGSVAYVILEVLPDLMGSRTARRATRGVENIINPNKHINAAAQRYSITNTVENSLLLADQCVEKGMHSKAAELYRKALTGVHEHDPDILYRLADTEFRLGNYAETRRLLDLLIAKNPDYKNQEAHLLFAKTVDELGDTAKAREEYAVLAGYYSGAEAKVRYATLLRRQGDAEQADALLTEILQTAKIAGRHFHTLNKEWITLAKRDLGR